MVSSKRPTMRSLIWICHHRSDHNILNCLNLVNDNVKNKTLHKQLRTSGTETVNSLETRLEPIIQ